MYFIKKKKKLLYEESCFKKSANVPIVKVSFYYRTLALFLKQPSFKSSYIADSGAFEWEKALKL